MKLLFDFFPILLFFVTFKLYDDPKQGVMAATAVAIVATFVQVGFFWLKFRQVKRMHLITLAILVVMGGATLILRDEMFIKWKPTAINWLFALVFLASQYVGKAPLVRRMLDSEIQLPDAVWTRLNLSWAAFFALSGCANLYVVYHFDTNTWVNFKLFGLGGLTVLFIVAQAFYLARHIKSDEEAEESG